MTVQAAIVSAIRTIMDDEDFDVRWADREAVFREDTAHVSLRVVSTPRQGVDEVRRTIEGGLPATLPATLPLVIGLRERVLGNRSLRVQVTVDVDDQDYSESAHEIAETIAQGFNRTDVATILDADRLGVPRCQALIEVPTTDDHRDSRSVVVFEAWFPWRRIHTGPLLDTVREVHGTATVEDEETAWDVVG